MLDFRIFCRQRQNMGFSEPEQAQAAFYRAFLEMDVALMEQVWSESPDTVCVHPGGDLLQGRHAVVQSWAEIFASADPPSLSYRNLQTTRSGDIAVLLVEELIRPGNKPDSESSRVLSTNIYRLSGDGWKMTAHHASLPVMRPRSKREQGRLH